MPHPGAVSDIATSIFFPPAGSSAITCMYDAPAARLLTGAMVDDPPRETYASAALPIR